MPLPTAGRCRLCARVGVLRDSHLLPKAIYRLARREDRRNPNPVHVADRFAVATSRQVSQPLLCEQCEQLFSTQGESDVMAQCYRGERSFRLREHLQSLPPAHTRGDIRVVPVQEATSRPFLYFAASIFWRSAAATWRFEGKPIESVVLGARYQEELRRYLLGEQAFPTNARVFVHTWRDTPLGHASTFPFSSRINGLRRHSFLIPGIHFILLLGKAVLQQAEPFALNSDEGSFMWLVPGTGTAFYLGIEETFRSATPVGALSRRRRTPT